MKPPPALLSGGFLHPARHLPDDMLALRPPDDRTAAK